MHVLRRVSASSAPQPRWAALPCLKFGDLLFSHSALSTFCVCEVEAVSLPSACSTCCRNPGARLSKRLICYFLDLTDYSLIPAAQKYYPFSLEVLNFYKTHP